MSMHPPYKDRRRWPRYRSRAVAKVVLDRDLMRDGLVGRAENISNIGVCLVLPAPVAIGERGVVELEDPIQRQKYSSPMRVERIEVLDDSQYRVGCSLFPGLNTHETLYLRSSR